MRSTIDFLQSSFSGFLAARSSRMTATSTIFAGAETAGAGAGETAAGAGETAAGAAAGAGAGAAGEAGVDGAVEATVVFGGAAVAEDAAVACPNIFDMRLVNIPIRAKATPSRKKLPAQRWRREEFQEGCRYFDSATPEAPVGKKRYAGTITSPVCGMASIVAKSIFKCACTSAGGKCVSHSFSDTS